MNDYYRVRHTDGRITAAPIEHLNSVLDLTDFGIRITETHASWLQHRHNILDVIDFGIRTIIINASPLQHDKGRISYLSCLLS